MTPAEVQSAFSAWCVPESSPRDANGASAEAIAASGRAGSARILLARAGLGLDDLASPERVAETQADLAAMIAIGEADCGLGIAAAAAGLGFLPLWTGESFDLVVRRRDYFEPPVQALMGFARSETFARQAAFLGGYDIASPGWERSASTPERA